MIAVAGLPAPVWFTAAPGTLPDESVGAQARFNRANKTNEVKPYTFEFVGLADDKNDPATALSEARRLVTQDDISALVPDGRSRHLRTI